MRRVYAGQTLSIGGCLAAVLTLTPSAPPHPTMPPGVHYLWFAFVCFLIRSHPPPRMAKMLGRSRPYFVSHTP